MASNNSNQHKSIRQRTSAQSGQKKANNDQ